MAETWKQIGDAAVRAIRTRRCFLVTLPVGLAEELCDYAGKTNHKPETIIAEALRAYIGDAA